jgi:hypothetical protein
MELAMQKRKLIDDYVKILSGKNNIIEKRELVMRAILENQIKFITVCKEKWGKDLYFKIVGEC